MRHRRHVISALVLALCTGGALLEAQQRSQPTVASLMRRLTIRQKVAQLVMPWLPGTYAAHDDPEFVRVIRWVDSLEVGGVIISVGSPLDIADKLNVLQRAARIPLLVSSDLEGGTAFRFVGGTGFPSNMGVGAGGSEEDAYAMGKVIAQEGRAVGIHITFSPVADVNNNPANPIINTRSFGGDPQRVARLVAAQIRGTQDHGMLATAKHFPGHGDIATDSHLSLPVLEADWRRLDSLELVPFRAAIAAGVGLVMSAHIALPGVDSGRRRPATLAPEIMSGVLRDSLGFRGLIVTDALNMGGVIQEVGEGEAVVQAFLAGSDLLLQPRDPAIAIQAMVRAVEEGRITQARLDASVRRVLALKRQFGLFRRKTVSLDSVAAMVGRQPAQEAARAASARAVVLLKDSTAALDSLRLARRTIGFVTYGEANAGTIGTVLAAELRRQGHTITLFRLHPTSGPASYDSARAVLAATAYPVLALSVRPRDGRGTVAMPEPLATFLGSVPRPPTVVSFGSPYLIQQVPSIGTYLLAWVANPLTERAVAEIFRGGPITGTLPIAIPPAWPIGAGLVRPARER